jgi:hypothetical protein
MSGSIASEILGKACLTEGPAYDTGLRVRGFEVWGIPPHQYRHFTEFFLRHPQAFGWSIRLCPVKALWSVGFYTPDGKWNSRYGDYLRMAKKDE